MTNTDFLSGVRTAADLATAATMEMHSHISKNGSSTHSIRIEGSWDVFKVSRNPPTYDIFNTYSVHDGVGQVRNEGDGETSLKDVKVGSNFPLPVAEILCDSDHLASVGIS